jgi:TetR/AcrR family transcriptional regulator, transcriptional repressor for nem operon
MRYPAQHKAETHRKIVKDASRRVRAEGINGAAVNAVMRDAGLTHGGFYKHFNSKDELLMESVSAAFADFADQLASVGEQARPGQGWKAIVKSYLSPGHSDHVGCGCPLAALGPELARADKAMKPRILAELVKYRDRILPYMPGRRTADKERAFFAIFSTMIGATELARLLPEGEPRARVLTSARDLLLRGFDNKAVADNSPSL